MFSELTPAVERAVLAAQARAGTRGAARVQSEDLLYGLLQEEEGRPCVLLSQAGADVGTISASLEVAKTAHVSESPLPFDKLSEEVLNHAADLAAEWTGQHIVGSDALLVALLRHDA